MSPTKCPHCGRQYLVNAREGESVQCPQCKKWAAMSVDHIRLMVAAVTESGRRTRRAVRSVAALLVLLIFLVLLTLCLPGWHRLILTR